MAASSLPRGDARATARAPRRRGPQPGRLRWPDRRDRRARRGGPHAHRAATRTASRSVGQALADRALGGVDEQDRRLEPMPCPSTRSASFQTCSRWWPGYASWATGDDEPGARRPAGRVFSSIRDRRPPRYESYAIQGRSVTLADRDGLALGQPECPARPARGNARRNHSATDWQPPDRDLELAIEAIPTVPGPIPSPGGAHSISFDGVVETRVLVAAAVRSPCSARRSSRYGSGSPARART